MMQHFPKWVAVKGPGHPDHPGHVLVENEDQEREAKKTGKGDVSLNPPPDAGMKALKDMDREELILTLTREGIPDDTSDDELRKAIEHTRKEKAKKLEDAAKEDRKQREAGDDGGDTGDGKQTDKSPRSDDDLPTDSAGDAISPDVADEANKGSAADQTRTLAHAKSRPAHDAQPDEAKNKQDGDEPAGNISEVAATPQDDTKPRRGRPPLNK